MLKYRNGELREIPVCKNCGETKDKMISDGEHEYCFEHYLGATSGV